MSFPMYPTANPLMGMNAPIDPFQSSMFASVPGAFPPPMPIAMSAPGIFSPVDPFAPVLPFDPYGMPAMADPMSGLPMDPMYTTNPFMAPAMVDPMTGMSVDPYGMPPMVDPMTGMSIEPLMGSMPIASGIDPMMGMPLPMMSPPLAGLPPIYASEYMPEQDSPLKQMLKNLLKMQLFKKLFNPGDPSLLNGDLSQEPVSVTDNVTALDLISDADNFDELSAGDGSVSYLDLSRAARKSGNAEVKAAASYILNTNPDLFDQLESIKKPGDGIFTEKDLGKALRNKSIIQGKPGQGSSSDEKIVDNISALDQLATKFSDLEKAGVGPKGKKNGKLTFVELSRASNNSDDPAIKELATYLMRSGLFSRLDELDPDDGVALSAINHAYQDQEIVTGQEAKDIVINTAGMTEQQALQIISNNAAKIDRLDDPKNLKRSGKANSRISIEDLDAVINSRDKSVTMDMKKAAQVLKDSGTIAKLDASEATNNTDSAASFTTLRSWAADYDAQGRKANGPKDLQQALQIINGNITAFTNGDAAKKSISYTDLLVALTSADPKYTPEVKGAVQYIKDHRDQFEKLDKMDTVDDDNVRIDLINDASIQDVSEDYGFNGASISAEKNREALTIFRSLISRLEGHGGGGGDSLIGEDNMRSALASTDFSVKERAVLNYVFNISQGHTTLWEGMDGGDSLVGDGDLRGALNANRNPGDIRNDNIDHNDG